MFKLENPEYCSGSGIIIYFDNRDDIFKDLKKDILYLFLECNAEFDIKYLNKLDFPKGAIDEGEYSLDCAIRETEEEIGLKKEDYNFIKNKSGENFKCECGKGLIMYLAELKKDSIGNTILKINPKTNILEHSGFKWMSYSKNIENLPKYLQKSLDWAHSILENNLNNL